MHANVLDTDKLADDFLKTSLKEIVEKYNFTIFQNTLFYGKHHETPILLLANPNRLQATHQDRVKTAGKKFLTGDMTYD